MLHGVQENLRTVTVVMPAFNESEGISDFIEEIERSINGFSSRYIVVNDCSSDDTADKALSLNRAGIRVEVHSNATTRGHGPSTLEALRLGLETESSIVIAVDGDGQFLGRDILKVATTLFETSADVIEGVRTSRNEPIFRRVVTLSTRFLVGVRVGEFPKDANTPLRAYKTEVLKDLLSDIPANSLIPNLFISVSTRRKNLYFLEIPVRSIKRRGTNSTGTTWGKQIKIIPPRRFIKFCTRAIKEWFKSNS